MSQLDTEEGGGVGGHSSSKGGTETREEGLEASLSVKLAHNTTDRDVAFGCLQAGLDGVNGKDRNPHGNTGGSTGACDGRQAELSTGLTSDGIDGSHGALDVFVGSKISSRARAVAGKGSSATAEDAAETALAIELANDIDTTVVLWLFARSELLLALDLQNDLDTLEGGGNGSHGNSGEEASS